MTTPPYTLLDAVAMHREHPDTFPIPSRSERTRVRKGDLVKLTFELPAPVDGLGSERMWVAVERRERRGWRGRLENVPQLVDGLALGDTVQFSAQHICDLIVGGVDAPVLQKTALVSRRVFAEGMAPGLLGRDEPIVASDSGWQAGRRAGGHGLAAGRDDGWTRFDHEPDPASTQGEA